MNTNTLISGIVLTLSSCAMSMEQPKSMLRKKARGQVSKEVLFYKAVEKGNLGEAKKLLVEGADLHAFNEHLQPIHAATIKGFLKVVEWLVKQGADITTPTTTGKQLVHLAAQNGHLAVLEWLHTRKADIRALYKLKSESLEPIHIATLNGHLPVIEWLCRHGVDSNTPTASGILPIHYAAQAGYLDIVVWLVAHGASVNTADIGRKGYQPLHYAAISGDLGVVAWLIAHGADITATAGNGHQPLSIAIKKGHVALIPFLLLHGESQDGITSVMLDEFKKSKPLVYAVLSNLTIDQALLTERSVEEYNEAFPLMVAFDRVPHDQIPHLHSLSVPTVQAALLATIVYGRMELAEMLYPMLNHCDLSDDKLLVFLEMALHDAIIYNRVESFEALYPMFRNRTQDHGMLLMFLERALYQASMNGREEIVHFILHSALIFNHAPELSLSKTGNKLNELTGSTRKNRQMLSRAAGIVRRMFTAKRPSESLLQIRQMLVRAARLRSCGILQSRFLPNDPTLSNLAILPPELLSIVAGFTLSRSEKDKGPGSPLPRS